MQMFDKINDYEADQKLVKVKSCQENMPFEQLAPKERVVERDQEEGRHNLLQDQPEIEDNIDLIRQQQQDAVNNIEEEKKFEQRP